GGDTGQSLGVGPPPPSSACTHRPRGRRLTPDDYPDTIRPDWCGCCGAGGLSSSPKTRRLLRPQQAPFPTAGITNPLLDRSATAWTILRRGRTNEATPPHSLRSSKARYDQLGHTAAVGRCRRPGLPGGPHDLRWITTRTG